MMAKKTPKATETTPTPAPEPKSNGTPRTRGLRGVSESAVITVLAATNPKRPSSKSYGRFALYVNGMTVKAALDAGVLTPDLAWDSKHGFITIEGYDPGAIVTPKVREPKAPKEKKVKEPKVDPEVDAAAAEELMA
jgi:hypothetical protein